MAFPRPYDSDSAGDLPWKVSPALSMLLQAYDYAKDLDRDKWDFGLEIDVLRTVGLSNSDFRWLICAGYVEHARDVADPGDVERIFHPDRGLVFSDRTCFVLSEIGVEAARSIAATNVNGDVVGDQQFDVVDTVEDSPAGLPKDSRLPHWDGERHQLHFEGFLVKEFKVHSPNQESILAAFEEEAWPPRIDDPLHPSADLAPKERLRNTIKSLNRTQSIHLIKFMGDGTGLAIRWEPITEGQNCPNARNRNH